METIVENLLTSLVDICAILNISAHDEEIPVNFISTDLGNRNITSLSSLFALCSVLFPLYSILKTQYSKLYSFFSSLPSASGVGAAGFGAAGFGAVGASAAGAGVVASPSFAFLFFFWVLSFI